MKAHPNVFDQRITLAVMSFMLLLTPACQKRPQHSPEVQRFFECYKRIEMEMTQSEVDSILGEFKSYTHAESRDFTNTGHPLTRPSVKTKTFDNIKNAHEGVSWSPKTGPPIKL